MNFATDFYISFSNIVHRNDYEHLVFISGSDLLEAVIQLVLQLILLLLRHNIISNNLIANYELQTELKTLTIWRLRWRTFLVDFKTIDEFDRRRHDAVRQWFIPSGKQVFEEQVIPTFSTCIKDIYRHS